MNRAVAWWSVGVAAAGLGSAASGQVAREGAGQSRTLRPVFELDAPSVLLRSVASDSKPASFPSEFRTIDGRDNNPTKTLWGAAHRPMRRAVPAAYADGASWPAGGDRPSPRAVSNAVHAQVELTFSPLGATDWLWQWGQFLDHDFAETPIATPAEAMPIAVPAGDPFFDPTGAGDAVIELDRSAFAMVDDAREQMNIITSYIDASVVYGSEDDRAEALRTLDGTGRLATSPGGLMPFNTRGLPNAMTTSAEHFLAGDVRANEQTGLTAVHTLFVREHNYWADRIAAENPGLDGDEIYERARAMVGAIIQAISYNEFFPLLLGPDAIPPYEGYRPDVDPTITNVFATAAYRVGHTMLSPTIARVDADGHEIPEGHLPLRDAFFKPAQTAELGIDVTLRGLASRRAQDIDRHIVDDVRNFLFGPPGAGGFDLASLNIQRGRDHGLASYNDVREAFGLPRAASFSEIASHFGAADALAAVYDTPDDVDAWTGMVAERRVPGALVGETLRAVIVDQAVRLRDGDRFWYQAYLPPELVAEIDATRLSDVIRRNTEIGDELAGDVFRLAEPCLADMDGNRELSPDDIAGFVRAFLGQRPAADVDGTQALNGRDIEAFVRSFSGGCGF